MSHERILIMAGGTGGHVYPALAVAEYLRRREKVILWLGTDNGLETQLVPENGYELITVRVRGLRGKGLLRLLVAPFMLVAALFKTMMVIQRFKPDAVLGMGGYVTGPGGIAAWMMRKPLYIHEQNAVAGLTNRLLSPFATLIMQGFPGAFHEGDRVRTTGNPVREEIIRSSVSRESKTDGNNGDMCLLVLGGSQGARALNQAVPSALKSLPADNHVQVWHQTGKQHLQQTRQTYSDCGLKEARVEDFIDDMASAYAWADLVLCRAGALTLAELCVAGLASVLVPFPYAVDDHQTANARFLSNAGAAVLVPESELQGDRLATILAGFCHARARLQSMAEQTRGLARADATARVAEICLGGASA